MVEKEEFSDNIYNEKVDHIKFKEELQEKIKNNNLEKYLSSGSLDVNIRTSNSISSKTHPIVYIRIKEDKDDYDELINFFEDLGYTYKGKNRNNMKKELEFKP